MRRTGFSCAVVLGSGLRQGWCGENGPAVSAISQLTVRAYDGSGQLLPAAALSGLFLFEIASMLDRFAALGKPLHITELGVASVDGPDQHAIRRDPGNLYWHAPWSETIQADWIEQFYTLCYAHEAVEAVTWWDFADTPGHFWPHGGLLRADLTPKESHGRLRRLIEDWRGTT